MEAIVPWKEPGPQGGLGSTDLPEPAVRELPRAQGLHPTQPGLGEKAKGVPPTPTPLEKGGV